MSNVTPKAGQKRSPKEGTNPDRTPQMRFSIWPGPGPGPALGSYCPQQLDKTPESYTKTPTYYTTNPTYYTNTPTYYTKTLKIRLTHKI